VTTKYDARNVGCYGDGAFGHQHVRERLAALVRECDAEVADALLGEMSDDAWEEDAALDLLNEHCAEGIHWTFESGDLVLAHILDEG
jgi:hypothetical protein